MFVRKINLGDSKFIFDWRNDKTSREMSFKRAKVSFEEHSKWLKNSIENPDREFYIAESKNIKIGVCRFDFNKKSNLAKVSININPSLRCEGYGKELLKKSIREYKKTRNCPLKALIKSENYISKNLFKSVGFKIKTEKDGILFLELKDNVNFKNVDLSDSEILYELLKMRIHKISHNKLPSFQRHQNFVKNHPYYKWYIIYLNDIAVGTFYIQNDNSIGINLNNPRKFVLQEIFEFITKNFDPKEGISSKIPNYFYLNVASTNIELINIIRNLGLDLIQFSFKLSK